MTLNLYIVGRKASIKLPYMDFYQSAIVAAGSPQEAKETFPRDDKLIIWDRKGKCWVDAKTKAPEGDYGAWVAKPSSLSASLIGVASARTRRGCVHNSFYGV